MHFICPIYPNGSKETSKDLYMDKSHPCSDMNHQRQGVIFDVEDQPDILTPLQNGENSHLCKTSRSPFVAEQESPLQRPRPPETRPTRPGFPPERGPRKRSFPNRWSHRLSAVILNRSNDFTRLLIELFSHYFLFIEVI